MKRKSKVHRVSDGRWHVEHPPFGFARGARTTVHDNFRSAIGAATAHTSGAGGVFEMADQHDYDHRQAPC